MNLIKKAFGIIWILLALAAGFFLIDFGWPKFISGEQDGIVFGIVILFILLPIIVTGLIIFGYYSLIGEYNDEQD